MYIYIYSLVGFGALCALGAAGAAGVFENLWKLIFRNSVFIYFWDLRHADIPWPAILACPKYQEITKTYFSYFGFQTFLFQFSAGSCIFAQVRCTPN